MKRGQENPVTGVTDGALRTILKGALRKTWRRTSRKKFIESVRRHDINPKTGRKWFVVDCADCGRVMGVSEKERRPLKKGGLSKKARSAFEVDHIHGITPLGNIKETLGGFCHDLLFGEQEIVCHLCHKKRTAKQAKNKSKKV